MSTHITVNRKPLRVNFQQYSDATLKDITCSELGKLSLMQLRYLDPDIVTACIKNLSPDSKADLLGQLCPTTKKYLQGSK